MLEFSSVWQASELTFGSVLSSCVTSSPSAPPSSAPLSSCPPTSCRWHLDASRFRASPWYRSSTGPASHLCAYTASPAMPTPSQLSARSPAMLTRAQLGPSTLGSSPHAPSQAPLSSHQTQPLEPSSRSETAPPEPSTQPSLHRARPPWPPSPPSAYPRAFAPHLCAAASLSFCLYAATQSRHPHRARHPRVPDVEPSACQSPHSRHGAY